MLEESRTHPEHGMPPPIPFLPRWLLNPRRVDMCDPRVSHLPRPATLHSQEETPTAAAASPVAIQTKLMEEKTKRRK